MGEAPTPRPTTMRVDGLSAAMICDSLSGPEDPDDAITTTATATTTSSSAPAPIARVLRLFRRPRPAGADPLGIGAGVAWGVRTGAGTAARGLGCPPVAASGWALR